MTNRCPRRCDVGLCVGLVARSVSGDRFACFRGYCDRFHHQPLDGASLHVGECETSAFWVAFPGGHRNDTGAWYYPEAKQLAGVAVCATDVSRYEPTLRTFSVVCSS